MQLCDCPVHWAGYVEEEPEQNAHIDKFPF